MKIVRAFIKNLVRSSKIYQLASKLSLSEESRHGGAGRHPRLPCGDRSEARFNFGRRAGWADDAKDIAARDEPLAWPEFGNTGDDDLAW